MAQQRIAYLGEEVLRKKAAPVTKFDAQLVALGEELVETMRQAAGLGLAAPQIRVSQRVIAVRVLDKEEAEEAAEDQAPQQLPVLVLVNPVIIVASEEEITAREGCLSLPTLQGQVRRAARVVVRAQGLDGQPWEWEATGLQARVLQHEIDHLDGILFIDRAEPESLVWLVPDEEEEEGYREEPTTLAEVVARFERLQRRQQGQMAAGSAQGQR
jgi:peptide deformylase